MKLPLKPLFYVALCLSPVVPPTGTRAAIPVVDIGNITQSILVALRTLQSNYNEARMIAHQIQSLEHEIRNLKNLRFDVIDDFNNNFSGLYRAIGRVDGIVQHIESLDRKFQEYYPEFNTQDGREVTESLSQMIRTSREMVETALHTGAQVIDALPQTQAQLERLTQASQGSVGILQATQAGNQIAGTIATQLANLNAQTATATQATTAYYMETIQTRAAMEHEAKEAIKDWGTPIKSVELPLNPIR